MELIQINATMTKFIEQCKRLRNFNATMKQKIYITKYALWVGIAYGFYVVAFSHPTINKLDKIITKLHKIIINISHSTPNVIESQLPYNLFGLGSFSLHNAYLKCIGEQLKNTLYDLGKLETIYQGLIKYITAKIEGAQYIPCITKKIICTFTNHTDILFTQKGC